MDFPAVDRVIYQKNPLAEVVCQIRFPRVLAIDERIPAEFQAHLGQDFPFVETREVAQFGLRLGEGVPPSFRTHYDFSTEDRDFTITLTSEFLSVRTTVYSRWEIFRVRLEQALEALTASYSISIFQRIGLRYIDIISRSKLGLDDVRWCDLIKGAALGLLAEDTIPIADVVELSAATALTLDDGGKVVIRTGLGRTDGTGEELAFVVDSDFFEDIPVKGADDAIRICNRFNKSSGRAFRWLIHDRLHDALGPKIPDPIT